MNDYYAGFDMGTDSVGWAVTDPDYNLCKFKGNAMWGIRLFDESNTAEERRGFRTSRRRTERKRRQSRCGACLSPLCPAWWRRSVLLL